MQRVTGGRIDVAAEKARLSGAGVVLRGAGPDEFGRCKDRALSRPSHVRRVSRCQAISVVT